MAIQDNPVNFTENIPPLDLPLEMVEVTASNKDNDNLATIQAAFLDNYVNGAPVAQSFFNFKYTGNPYESAKELARQKAELDIADLGEAITLDPEGELGSVEQNLLFTQQAAQEVQDSDVDQHFAEAALGPDGNLDDASRVASKTRMQKMLNEWQAEVGTGEKVMEVAKQFTLPFLESARGVKLTGEYFGAKDEVRAAIRAFRNKSPEEQERILPALKAELEDKVGNVDAVNILTSFMTAGGDEDFDRFGGEEVIFDILDAAGVGLTFTWALRGVAKGANTIKTLHDLKNYKAAEEASIGSLIDPEIRDAMGMDETSAVANALPFDTSIEVIERQGGLSTAVNDGLRRFFEESDEVAQNIITGQGFLREQAVSNKYRLQLEKAAEQKFQKEKAENIRIKEKTENSTTFEYQVIDEDGNLTDQTYELKLDLDNAGNFEQSTMGLIREYIGSPTAFARGMLREDVKTAERTDYLTSRINNQLTQLTRKALQPIGLIPTPKTKASLAKVDHVLREGDEFKNADGSRGTVFNVETLRQNYGLTEKEISAYYRVNRLYNNLWHIRNAEKRKELDTLGYRNINFSRSGENALGKHYENALTARAAINDKSIKQIYDASEDRILDLSIAKADIISDYYADNKVLVRMDDPYDIGGERGMFRYALVSADEVGDLPAQVLHRKKGYVPRLYEDAAYFVKERNKITVDGDKEYFQKSTLRFFDNKKDADAYRAQLREAYVTEKLGETATDMMSPVEIETLKARLEKEASDRYVRLSDREEEVLAAASGEASHSGGGGLYTGARAGDEILFGLEGTRANRVNSFDALMRNIGNVSRYASINQWRLGMEQRWINTANQIFRDKGIETRITKFERLPKTSESSPEVRFLNRVFDQIRDWQSFPTPEEQFFSNMMRGFYDWAAEHDYKKMARILGNFKDIDPIATARASAFHTLLGFFNPAHLWVQAQGMSVAVSLGFGKYLTRTIANTTALSFLPNKAADSKVLGMAAKAANIRKEELAAIHDGWVRTGFQDSVLQTADHAAAAKGYGMTMDAIRRTANAGLLFYRTGELASRRMAFTTAVERWKEKNKINTFDRIPDEDLKTILDDANNILLNMSKANRAVWQKGVFSLPTQFLQVTTKFVETATGLNQNFDKFERGRLLFGQLMLYGAAGVPLAGLGGMVAKEVFGMTQEDIDNNPTIVKAINDGFWGVTALHMFGADVELSSRGSLMRGVSDFVDNWFLQESSFAEKMLGPFGSTGQRFFDDFSRRLRAVSAHTASDIDWADIGKLATSPVFSMFSSYNNAQKAILMDRLDASFDRSGRVVATGFSDAEAIFQALGFQPTKVVETYDLEERTRYVEQFKRKVQGDLLKVMNDFAAKYPNGDFSEAAWEDHQRDMSLLFGLLDPDEQMETQEYLQRQMTAPSRRDMAINRYVENMKSDTVNDLSIIQQTLLGSKAIRTGITTEE
tara:strand:+ start:19381 stop:23739 length:4359 start_codon:yes stop_codon:yes gene_type:complete